MARASRQDGSLFHIYDIHGIHDGKKISSVQKKISHFLSQQVSSRFKLNSISIQLIQYSKYIGVFKKNVSSHSFSKNKQVSPQPCHSWPKLLMPSTQLAAPSNTTQLPSHVGKTSKNLPVLLGTVLSKVCWKMNQHKIYLNGKRKKEVTTNTRSELTCLKS